MEGLTKNKAIDGAMDTRETNTTNTRPRRREAHKAFSPEKKKATFSSEEMEKREERIRKLMPLVRAIARKKKKKLPSSVSVEDLISAGNLGAIEAVDHHDPTKSNLEGYAQRLINGRILDFLRGNDFLKRKDRDLVSKLNMLKSNLALVFKREPTISELQEEAFERLNWDKKMFHQVLELSKYVHVDNDSGIEDEKGFDMNRLPDTRVNLDHTVEMSKFLGILKDFLASDNLSPRNKAVMMAILFSGKTFREIGHDFGVHQSRVPQIRESVLSKLKSYLEEKGIHGYSDFFLNK